MYTFVNRQTKEKHTDIIHYTCEDYWNILLPWQPLLTDMTKVGFSQSRSLVYVKSVIIPLISLILYIFCIKNFGNIRTRYSELFFPNFGTYILCILSTNRWCQSVGGIIKSIKVYYLSQLLASDDSLWESFTWFSKLSI